MAERRMFAKTIIDSDVFLDMPLSTQALYFHLSMRADDDGFINNPKKIQRMIGCGDDDLKLLVAKKFLILFESGVIVIKHWRMHNYIQKDRYKETVYIEEKGMLEIKENKAYTFKKDMEINCIHDGDRMDTLRTQVVNNKYPSDIQIGCNAYTDGIQIVSNKKEEKSLNSCKNEDSKQCIQNGNISDTQVRLGKDSIGKESLEIDKSSIEIGEDSEEQATQHPSFPTSFHELIFNNFGEVTYKTWFADTTIETNGNLIVINVNGDLKKQVIQKYSQKISILTGKQISINDLVAVG